MIICVNITVGVIYDFPTYSVYLYSRYSLPFRNGDSEPSARRVFESVDVSGIEQVFLSARNGNIFHENVSRKRRGINEKDIVFNSLAEDFYPFILRNSAHCEHASFSGRYGREVETLAVYFGSDYPIPGNRSRRNRHAAARRNAFRSIFDCGVIGFFHAESVGNLFESYRKIDVLPQNDHYFDRGNPDVFCRSVVRKPYGVYVQFFFEIGFHRRAKRRRNVRKNVFAVNYFENSRFPRFRVFAINIIRTEFRRARLSVAIVISPVYFQQAYAETDSVYLPVVEIYGVGKRV